MPVPLPAVATLLRYLGPWAHPEACPTGVVRGTWLLREGGLSGRRADRERPGHRDTVRRLEAAVYRPTTKQRGTFLVAPGLHFDGPDDPRFDRFCRVLAAAGARVVAPYLPAFLDLTVHESAVDDFEIVARALSERLPAGEKPTVFSISFGSWPALETAARLGDRIDAVVTFGGYAEFASAVRFCVDGVMRGPDGDQQLARDPLNPPALFLNLMPHLDVPGDPATLAAAWREMAYRTWGRMELKAPGRLEPIARELSTSVPVVQRELFLIGCGVAPGAAAMVERALSRIDPDFANPLRHVAAVRSPAVVCHGRDDDVIPWGEAEKLASALQAHVPTELVLTGLYGHTGAGRPSPEQLLAELKALRQIVTTLSRAGHVRSNFL